jgi:ribosomal protein RSM22 (predicted rRNA methylase)
VRLVVCEPAGLNERVVSRRDKDIYRQAREARWGDRLQLDR